MFGVFSLLLAFLLGFFKNPDTSLSLSMVKLEEQIRSVIVAQETAINEIAKSVIRFEKSKLSKENERPLVLLFLGNSGVGKTESAKQIANYLHENVKNAFIRIDMAEYQESHSVSRFIGAPPGYVGFSEGGQLTNALKVFPNAVVLLDEVEKAHPDVLMILLSLFDVGRLTDTQGKTIEAKNAIFIMTSNLASDEIANFGSNILSRSDINALNKFKVETVYPILKKHFRRYEFMGRIKRPIYFWPFTTEELHQLVNKRLETMAKKYKNKKNIEIKWDQGVVECISKRYDVHFGARRILDAIEELVGIIEDDIDDQVIKNGDKVVLTAIDSVISPIVYSDGPVLEGPIPEPKTFFCLDK